MNILILISSINYGGAEKQAIIDANLLSRDHSVWLITFNGGPLESQILKKNNYHLLQKKGYLRTALKIHKIIFKNKIDIVHASLFAAMILSAMATLFSKTKVFWHFHSHEYDAPFYSKVAFMIFSRVRTVKKIVIVNQELKEYLVKRFLLPQKKLVLLYNSSGIECTGQKAETKDGPFIIGYIGRLVKIKRVQYLISLAEALMKEGCSNFEIWIVGNGDEYTSLKNEVRDKALDKKVKFLGYQEHTKPIYQKLDLFVLPSQEECLSISLIDAGICGIPAIAFDVGGNNEIILHEKTGFIVSTLEELISCVINLIEDNDLRKRLGNAAHEHCGRTFSQTARKEKLLSLAKNEF